MIAPASSMLLLSTSRNPSLPKAVVKLAEKLAVASVPKTLSSTVSAGSAVALIAIDGPSSLNTRLKPIFSVTLCETVLPSVFIPVSITNSSAAKFFGSFGSLVGCTTARI